MKRLTLLLMPLVVLSFLTNCGGKEKKDYLCFTAKEDNSSIYYAVIGLPLDIHIQKSTDGKKWEDWNAEEFVKLNTNEKIYVRNTEKTLSRDANNCFGFQTEGKIAASGNVMSMIDFGELYPACFCMMFFDSDGLVTPPELPATKLAQGCYYCMFEECDNLVVAPTLPATTLADNCYERMLSQCPKLKIKENGEEGTKIFTCPNEIPDDAVNMMFSSTGGEFTDDPTSGNTYYWYQ